MRLATGIGVLIATLLAAPGVAQWPGSSTESQKKAAFIVSEYANVLRTLDASKPESIIRARDAVLATYTQVASVEADAVFRQFWAFYRRVVRDVVGTSYPLLSWRTPGNRLLTEACAGSLTRCRGSDVDAFLRSQRPDHVRLREENRETVERLSRYRASGIAFDSGEGSWYVRADPDLLLATAAQLPLGELAEWVRFWAAEEPQVVAEDASLKVGWDDVRLRLARWERFGRAHPELPETEAEVMPHVRQLLAWYVFGIDNTRAYKPSIDPTLKASYDRFLIENRDSSYYSVVQGIVERLTRSDGRATPDLVSFLTSQLRDPYFRNWLRNAEHSLSIK